MTSVEMLDFFFWYDELRKTHSGKVFHYANPRTCINILQRSKVVFWLTRMEDFEDKYEGKTIRIYYDLAIEELRKENRITARQYELLSEVDVPKKYFIYFMDDGTRSTIPTGHEVECIPYIVCFSSKCQDDYMFRNYVHSEGDGCCMEFFPEEICDTATIRKSTGVSFQFSTVKYEYEAIDYLKKIILKLFQITASSDEETIRKYFVPILENALFELQYTVKLSKYRNENEERLILLLPDPNKLSEGKRLPYSERVNRANMKRYVEIELPTECFSNLLFAPDVSNETVEGLRERIRNNGYEIE